MNDSALARERPVGKAGRDVSPMKWPHHLWRWAFALAALIAAAAFAARWIGGPEVVVYPVQRGDLVRSVVASGHVETPYRVEIASQITGTVDEVLVQEGQFVKRGEPLIILETRELFAGVVQAEGAVAQAEAKLRQIREVMNPAAEEALKQAKATLANAESYYERADQLARSGYGTRSSLDDATKNLDIARTQVRTAELQVYTSAPGGSDYVLAETQLSQAQANLATAKARMSFGTIVAPRDGTLISRNVERGAVVQPGKALMGLAPLGDLQLVLQVDEKNIGLLKLGQPALASADAYPDQRFAAAVTYINPSVDISRASVLVKLTATDPPAYLRQDMTVSIDIEVERRPNTLIVPARTVHDANGASPWVLVVRDGRPRSQPVKLGLRAGERIEILDGVAQGDLLVPLSAGVRAGQRIRPVPS